MTERKKGEKNQLFKFQEFGYSRTCCQTHDDTQQQKCLLQDSRLKMDI